MSALIARQDSRLRSFWAMFLGSWKCADNTQYDVGKCRVLGYAAKFEFYIEYILYYNQMFLVIVHRLFLMFCIVEYSHELNSYMPNNQLLIRLNTTHCGILQRVEMS